ncbi:hypothetical protein GOBAR_AA26887 [Gossypium barbadense]|uniref:Uncharacterized protein n=1 Tax=Gossypium barbadense TaxID=3634 RepID=A0A2P5WRW2_GOSBA|nr:hypothetical protein GOBAR_AA26887 [Gossypium barbadense]
MQETVVSKGKSEVSHNKTINEEYRPRVPYPNMTRKDHSDEEFGELTLRVGDETITLQARNSGITSNIEGVSTETRPSTRACLRPCENRYHVIVKRKENRRACFEEEEGNVHFYGPNRRNPSPSPTVSPRAPTVMTRYDDLGTVQFRLGGLIHQLSVPEFGATVGLYTEEFREENELHALSRHIHFSPSKCWHTLSPSTASYNPSRSKALVLPPSLRTRHRPCLFHRPCDSALDRTASEGGHLHWPLRE